MLGFEVKDNGLKVQLIMVKTDSLLPFWFENMIFPSLIISFTRSSDTKSIRVEKIAQMCPSKGVKNVPNHDFERKIMRNKA